MRRFLTVMIGVFLLLSPAIFGNAAPAILVSPDSVQEDWQLIVAAPDTTDAGPQITTTMSPVADDSTPFVDFDLNYSEIPDFSPGGMQIQVWDNTAKCLGTSSQGSARLDTVNETITWTQSMSLANGSIVYGVSNGQSITWGKFGQGQGLLAVSYPATIADMSNYAPAVSVKRSAVSWQSNRVTSLTLTQVRYYAKGVLISTDTTPRSVTLTP